MNQREIALTAVMSALTIVIAVGKGFAIPFLPGLIEFMTVIIFVNGFCFGPIIGGTIGTLTMAIRMIIPSPFAHPTAWIFTISPILLVAEAVLGAMYGIVGGIVGRKWNPNLHKKFVAKIALTGFTLTFIYQILSSVGFYLAYPIYPSMWDAIYWTFIPLFYPYPPITHAFTNTIVFALIGPALILAIKKLPTQTIVKQIVDS